jgi:holliday junction DNA helicase RuvA
MIGKIAGRLDYRATDHVLVDTGGVGYLVYCSDRVLAAMPAPGEPVALYTEMVVREDLIQLFGFATLAEREWHRLLMSVQGVGARSALAVLGALGAEGVARAVTLGDLNAIRSAPGIGPKIAQRILLELKAKAPAMMAMGGAGAAQPGPAAEGARRAGTGRAGAGPAQPSVVEPASGVAAAQAEALSALINLGYAHGDAAAAVAEACEGMADVSTPELIRASLRRLAPRG